MTTANKFTLLRLILVIPFITLLSFICITIDTETFIYNNISDNTQLQIFMIALVIFVLAMITDFIDGYIARKTQTITSFGKLFDPLADKFMITSALIALSVLKIIPVYLVIIMVLRDILVDATRTIAASNNKTVAANIWGKLKTIFQSFSIILAFALSPIWLNKKNTTEMLLFNIPMFISTILSVLSGIIYFCQIKTYIKLK